MRKPEDHRFPYSLGATLYLPIIHPKVPEIVSGQVPPPASSLVLCLEDALHENDVERGIEQLKEILAAPVSQALRVFVRPRSYDMARRLADLRGITGNGSHGIEGFVAPKMRPETLPDWLDLVAGARLSIMPTLETTDCFDPIRVGMIRDILCSHAHAVIPAIRLGGNDLLGLLSLRRRRGETLYDGPLSWVIPMLTSMLTSAGIPVAAPVFDIIDDLETLRREVERDIEMGFISKTAIHPVQVPVIEEAMRVRPEDLAQARAVLHHEARAVFQIGGVMCEPATHRNWAERILARHRRFGETGVTPENEYRVG